MHSLVAHVVESRSVGTEYVLHSVICCCGTRMDKGQLLAMCKASREETLLVSHEHKGKTIRMRLSSKTSKRLLQVELSSYLEEEDTLSERQHQVTVVLLKKREKLLAQHKLRLDDEEKLSDQFVKKREQIGSKHKLSLKRHEAICESFRKRKRAADERTWSAAARRDAFIAVQGAVRADKRRRMDCDEERSKTIEGRLESLPRTDTDCSSGLHSQTNAAAWIATRKGARRSRVDSNRYPAPTRSAAQTNAAAWIATRKGARRSRVNPAKAQTNAAATSATRVNPTASRRSTPKRRPLLQLCGTRQ
eukprot:TRINITY_DN1069_c0_g1_i13.p1 TRINITY_DN1069_c0_g1~~TRINITY_DN1069_c0_g1_i13.p1  ORF type:complete len:305 (+),score=25.40 TRINITY_DN1069_c0_g1_i13:87-1001(+)